MHSAKLTIAIFKKSILFVFVIFTCSFASAQENAPYSRFGIGDLAPTQNIVSRSMGGITTGFIDVAGFATINLTNPAALGSLNSTLFDFAFEIDKRTLKNSNTVGKFSSNNTTISYLQLGFPITPKKMLKKGNYWGVAFGLKPVSKINYKVLEDKRIIGIDSLSTLYEGTGGINQANISTGVKIKNFSFGLSTGYSFGNRDISTKKEFVNDSIFTYHKSNSQTQSNFGGLFLTLGALYDIKLKNNNLIRIGASANLKQKLKGKKDKISETIFYANDGTVISWDIIDSIKNLAGNVQVPASYSAGFTYTNPHWVVGADIDYAAWKNYTYFGATDALQNTMKLHIGGQYYPATATTTAKKYWRFVKYRAGFYYGNDYVKLGNNRPDYGFTLGAGLPLTSFQRLRFGEFVTLNTGIEIGQKGNKQITGLKEGIFKVNFGISMSAAWFQKRKYD